MKSKFQSHFPPSAEMLDSIWADSRIAFDSNVLRDLYGFSEDTTGVIFEILKKYSSRLWLPNKCVEEYLNGRESEIGIQEKKYDEMIKSLGALKTSLEAKANHPFISRESHSEFLAHLEKINEELESGKEIVASYLLNDPIRD